MPRGAAAAATADASGGRVSSATVAVGNIPPTARASELLSYFDSVSGGAAFAAEIFTAHTGWLPRGHGRVQFSSSSAAAAVAAAANDLPRFQGSCLAISAAERNDVIPRAASEELRYRDLEVMVGNRTGEREFEMLDSWDGVGVEVIQGREKVELFVRVESMRYKLEVMFEDIRESSRCSLNGKNAILLQLNYAPRIYCAISGPKNKSRFMDDRYHSCKEDAKFIWVRTPDFTANCSIGNSFSFLLLFGELPSSMVLDVLPCSKDLGELCICTRDYLHSSSKLAPIVDCPSGCFVPYEILFRVNSLIHTQKIAVKHANYEFFDMLGNLPTDQSIQILEKMSKLQHCCYQPMQFIQDEMSQQKRVTKKSTDSVMSCYRVLVTPTKLFCLGPEKERSNYVVKHFSSLSSHFIRVSFVDEDWSKLISTSISTRIEEGLLSKPFRTGIYHRILNILKYGITIGSRQFEFLAFSASQLRGSSVWMFASDGTVTAESIRHWMGHFKDIRSISKCASRMGQLFSSSTQTLDVQHWEVLVIPDIEITTDGNKHKFSDGIGKVSISLARKIAQKCCPDTKLPSAFQIRFGGYKGVIAVDPTLQHKISLRPSMKKFDSESTMLSITNWSKYQASYLNREIISLLSTLGVADEVFESLLEYELLRIDSMLTDKDVALKVVGKISGVECKTAAKMMLHGYMPSTEPYLWMILKVHRENRLSEMKSRCRILLPKGRVLMGCLDEIGKLEYGQVFIKTTKKLDGLQSENESYFHNVSDEEAVVLGKVMVTRNPCLHPGDIRVLEAVYDDDLDATGLVDCIIFPQKGPRPHPTECSGGDLDGDLYFISWDERLIPQSADAPMDYAEGRPRIMDHEVTLEEIQKFFLEYMINDTLGAISNAHLIHADREPEKARSSKCIELAKLHSMAVDFAKHGTPAEMPNSLKPRTFPDFMERSDMPMYVSTGVLGKLYRMTSDYIQKSEAAVAAPPSFAYDTDLEIPGFEAFVEEAEGYYDQYAHRLSILMNYYDAKREEEILTGNFRHRPLYLKKDNKRYGEMKDRIAFEVNNLHREVRGWYESSCEGDGDEKRKMASAWYHVTYHSKYPQPRFLSFPWIISDALLSIKGSKRQESVDMECTSLDPSGKQNDGV